ncbi:MAG: PhoH family protein [Alphaproteobacteria bacterium]|nr:MAG: PhoH family protein [Alphaproteobacteria bacterium]
MSTGSGGAAGPPPRGPGTGAEGEASLAEAGAISAAEPGTPARTLEFPDNRLLIELCGAYDRNLAAIERAFGVQIARRGNSLQILGEPEEAERAAGVLQRLWQRLEAGQGVDAGEVAAAIHFALHGRPAAPVAAEGRAEGRSAQLEMFGTGAVLRTRRRTVEARTPRQAEYLRTIWAHDLVFGLGPAGTGKTYLGVAAAVAMLDDGLVERIVLSRPAVEAGERIGFLPGDVKEKVDPYMQPLYDALHDFLPARQLARMLEERRIEIAPLAFMRGRTLARAFVLLDEAQNATALQMKMFLTRMGEGARMVVTGDESQVDLPGGTRSGLAEAVRILEGVEGVGIARFTAADVVRHPLVARIIRAWDADAAARGRGRDRGEGR